MDNSNDTLDKTTLDPSRQEKRKLSESQEETQSTTLKKQKWKNRGVNKNRPTFKVDRLSQLCHSMVDRRGAADAACSVAGCQFQHDVQLYLADKLPDIGDRCYVFDTTGHCPRGITCRFGSAHTTEGGLNVVDEIVQERWKSDPSLHTINGLDHAVQVALRKRTYDFGRADRALAANARVTEPSNAGDAESTDKLSGGDESNLKEEAMESKDGNVEANKEETGKLDGDIELTVKKVAIELNGGAVGPVIDSHGERKKLDWRDKLLLAPLTTVGNLPFRRICVEYGADVTCGEMAMATCLLQGKPQEWALTKRHASERVFGVQLCANNAATMTKCAQLLSEQTDIDFVDINVGCPIDLVYRQGAGSGLLNKKKVLLSMVRGMKGVLDVPLTLKTRTGVYNNKNVAHSMMRELTDAGIDLITVHGRTKEQRYTKLADWDYVEQCARLAAPTPLVGNGDILSYEDYDLARERSPTSVGVMVGRGALYKPWIFTEIKERRHWDISSAERLDMLRRYSHYGLHHWGSDTRGVETTRRFLLEWQSFLYRYVPVGLMGDKGPQRMNERPPPFTPRDELEALMASPNCQDWIKISEMLLGPVPSGFQFLPKHKANSWT